MIIKCQLCGEELEKLGENHYSCKTCGLGTDGKSVDLKLHLKKLTDFIIKAKKEYPELSTEEITDYVQNELHELEHHPLDQHDYCIYCNKSFKEQV